MNRLHHTWMKFRLHIWAQRYDFFGQIFVKFTKILVNKWLVARFQSLQKVENFLFGHKKSEPNFFS